MFILEISDNVEEQKMSNIMCVIMSNLQGILTYISMVNSNQFTIDTIDHLQQIVDKSEFAVSFFFTSVYHFIKWRNL